MGNPGLLVGHDSLDDLAVLLDLEGVFLSIGIIAVQALELGIGVLAIAESEFGNAVLVSITFDYGVAVCIFDAEADICKRFAVCNIGLGAFFPVFDKSEYTRTVLGHGEDNGVTYDHVLYERKPR